MILKFDVNEVDKISSLTVNIEQCIIAGWAGRDPEAIEHHIRELEAIGVPRPSSVPLYYRVAENQLSQKSELQSVGIETSGEAEVFIFSAAGKKYISIASDHTDRKLEAHSVALSKQICVKPVAAHAWLYSDVLNHWDQLILRSWIYENGQKVLYQEGDLAQLLSASDLINGLYSSDSQPDNHGMTCGTVAVKGGIRAAEKFIMELHDPILKRSIRHEYKIEALPVIA